MDANIFELDMWFFLCLILTGIIIYDNISKPVISVKKALSYLKKNLIRLIVFYQSNYNAGDQIVLVKKWIDSINIDNVPKEQMKLFKDFVNKL